MPYQPWASSPSVRAAMRGNKKRDTKPELALRSALHVRGLRFRKDLRLDLGAVRVRPDVVFTSARVAVFVDGCFWHRCPEHGNLPGRNSDYWTPKLRRNVERDHLQNEALAAAGWAVIRIWEHEDVKEASDRVHALVASTREPNPPLRDT